MLTQCDRCAAVFRIHPAQLRQAQGFVRCGACQQVFYAVDRLLEERTAAVEPEALKPDDTPALRAHGIAAPAAPPRPSFPDGEVVSAETVTEPAQPSPPPPVAAPIMLQATDLPPLRRDTADLEDAYELEVAQDETPVTRDALSVSAHTEETDADAPEVLQQDLAALRSVQHARRSWRWFWVTSALLLLLILAGQIAWQLREALLTRFPDWRTPVERWCATLGCRLDAEANAPEIELLARDVRDHPRFPDALLANVTMISRAQSVQRYPTIEMSLFDRTGRTIGRRRFAPDEYLDPSIDVDAGMQPSRPVFVVLELAGMHRDAVGFEFAFR
ncbi:MAG: zinc-ribbon domain-containing protein [Gammaproteobacteria bacterium]|nr:zinc-ribbon domain-containing protein [Gammaproteobacteria bacterium]